MNSQGHSAEGCWKLGCQDKRVEGGRLGRSLLRPRNIPRIDSKSSKRTILRFRFHMAYEEARLIRCGAGRCGRRSGGCSKHHVVHDQCMPHTEDEMVKHIMQGDLEEEHATRKLRRDATDGTHSCYLEHTDAAPTLSLGIATFPVAKLRHTASMGRRGQNWGVGM
ncbi:hypothetical protein VNO77_03754 [Canavalia gladiata]|uniref:Uncharacterized protein n=1 Tax=Canavalia gladiata TaxID=3824 RepID=A0AAN9MVB0_CANGL